MTTTPTSPAAEALDTPSLGKILRCWLPTFLGFPLGGLLAELVGPVDAPGRALAGGAVTGAVLGVVQFVGLVRSGAVARGEIAPELWSLATAVGLSAGLAAGAAVVDYGTSTSDLAVQGVVTGAAVGLAQALVLGRRVGAVAAVWPVALAGLWALGWTITASIGVDVESRYTVFGSSGAITVTFLTTALPWVLSRRRVASAA